MLLNIHTHQPCPSGEQTIPSFGLHPWQVTAQWPDVLSRLMQQVQADKPSGPFLVGECGLDRVCDVPYQLQLQAFQAQIKWAGRLQCPLILHCVRALDDVLRLHRAATQPWIWHGFRGKPEQLRQLLRAGFYVSFGWRYNAESLRSCPPHRLFLETDDGPAAIGPLYAQVAAERGIAVQALAAQVWENWEHIADGDRALSV